MGTWGADILASDSALDSLDDLEGYFGLSELYPMDYGPKRKVEIRARLNTDKDQIFGGQFVTDIHTTALVFAALTMNVGASMSQRLRDRVLEEIAVEIKHINDNGWRDEGKERLAVLSHFKTLVTDYVDGIPIEIEHKGLFETIGEHLS